MDSKDFKLSQIVIMNVYKREAEGKYLKKLIDISAKPYGIPVQISFDDGSLGIWKNYANALTMDGGIDGSHRMVIHDDITFDRNILGKILYIMKFAPKDKIVVLYNPSNSDYANCYQQHRHVLSTASNFWVQAAIYPNELAKDFVQLMDVIANEGQVDDRRLSAYLKIHKSNLFVIVPSLVQHLGAFRSNFRQGGDVGGVVRYSSTYDNQFAVEKVNWKEEFAHPYMAKMKTDRTKEVVNKEFYEQYKKW